MNKQTNRLINKQKNKNKQKQINTEEKLHTKSINVIIFLRICKLHVYAANSERKKMSCELFEIEGGI